MEGYLLKKEGFFSGWVQYYFILHEDMLVYLDKKGGKPLGTIHMKIAKIQPDKKDKLLLQIFNGTNEIYLKAHSIKDMVEWTNSLITCQKQCLEGRYDSYLRKSTKNNSRSSSFSSLSHIEGADRQSVITDKSNWHDLLNMKFCAKLFQADSPFFLKLGQIWEIEAELQEVISLLVPEANRTKNPLLIDYADQMSRLTESLKEKMTEVFTDLEDTRREMFKVAKNMVKIKDNLMNQQAPQQFTSVVVPVNFKNATSQSGGSSPNKDMIMKQFNQTVVSPIKTMNQVNVHGSPGQIIQSPGYHSYLSNNGNPGLYSQNSLTREQQKYYNELNRKESYSGGKNQQSSQMNLNSHLFEEFKEEKDSQGSQGYIVPYNQMSYKPNIMIGFGGIPITYTMRMREQLPALIPENQSYSIWAILKSALGKDLSRITMPIWLNEPISMLQKISECSHYSDIMCQAVKLQDPYKKMGYIGIFVMSQYSNVYLRNRKPFNPILGETFEIIQPNFRIVCEQVSHHPPITAFNLEGNGWTTHGDTDVRNYFRGSSLEFRAVGVQHMYLTETNEHLVIKRPDNSANNLIMGKLYVDVHGKLEVINVTKNTKTVFTIHRQGWTKKNAYRVEGQVFDENGVVRYEVNGRWNEYLSIKDCSTGIEEMVFKADPKPALTERMYGFGLYSINLNYVDDEMLKTLPPTDCRRRPDQRLMELGKYDEAADEKHRLEEKQRAVRKQREEMGQEYRPRFFQEVKDEYTGGKMYQFTNSYWEMRKNLSYEGLPDLF